MANRFTTAGLLAIALMGTAGCGMTDWLMGDNTSTPSIAPDAFVRVEPQQSDESANVALASQGPISPASTNKTDAGSADASASDSAPTTRAVAMPINAMVGHINSEAVYADQIFDVNLIAQLQSFGKRFDDEQFMAAASQVIQERLRGVIINKLILGEAEMNLKSQQRQYIDAMVDRERDELIRFHGQGSVSKARSEFLKDKGLELDDHLNALREEYAVQAFLQAKVIPKISISQINVQNYYEDNKAKYHHPDLRSFRIIRVADAETATAIEDKLKRGKAFKDIASDAELNLYNPAGSGYFNGGKPIPGDKIYGIEQINEALMTLEEGQHAGPFIAGDHHYFTQLVTYKPGKMISLADAQIEIELILRNLEYERQVIRLRVAMLERGSYTSPEKMGAKLLEIAAARYDQ